MSKTRRRSTSWMKELIRPAVRIDVASLEIPNNQLDLDSDIKDNVALSGKQGSQISFEITTNHSGDSEELNVKHQIEYPEQPREKQHLEHYFRFLHCVGLASFKEFWKTAITPSYVIHKALFWLLATLAIFDAVKMAKLSSIVTATENKEDMYRYVVIGRYIFNCTKRIFFITIVSSGSYQIVKIFTALNSLQQTYGVRCRVKTIHVFVFVIGISSLVAAVLHVIFGWVTINGQGESWSPYECVLEQSIDMSLSLFVWTNNITKMDEQYITLYKSYAENITPTTVSLGVIGIGMGCVGSLLDYAANDIMLFSAVTIYKLGKSFQLKLTADNLTLEDGLKLYHHLQNVSNCIEEAFGWLFRLTHANNLLLCANIVLVMVSDTEYNIGIILLLLQILKVWTTYCLAVKATAMNKFFRQWIRNKITENDTLGYDMKLKATTFLNESLESPLGIGSDTFFIDEIFVLKFVTMVGTFSMFLFDKKKKSEIG